MAETAVPRLKLNFYVEIDWGKETKKEVKVDTPNTNHGEEKKCYNAVGNIQNISLEREGQFTNDNVNPNKQKRCKGAAKSITETTNGGTSTENENEPKKKPRKKREQKHGVHECLSCDLVFDKKSYLQRHTLSHTGEKPYSCSLCHQNFSLQRNLSRHIQRHAADATPSEAKPFHCNSCQYKCLSKSLLKVHMRTHTGEKPYSCTYCTYKSALKCNLKTHILTHTLEKPFACTICDYTCARKSTLKVHTRCHATDASKPHACPRCARTFGRKGYLLVHMRSHEPRDLRCPACAYTCHHQPALHRHLLTHRLSETVPQASR